MANEVEIDEAALLQQAAAVDAPGGDMPAADGSAAEVVTDSAGEVARAEAFARQSAPVIGKLLRGVAGVAVPNWHISDEQHEGLSQSVAYALALWFPHEIPPKWAALLGVGMVGYAIVESNRDPATGELRPRVKPRTDGAATAA